MAIRDRHHDVIALIEPMPREVVLADQDLTFWYALALLSTAQAATGIDFANEFSDQYGSIVDTLAVGRNHVLQTVASIMEGSSGQALAHALEATRILPTEAIHERFRAWATVDTLAGHTGDRETMNAARSALTHLRDLLPVDQHWWYAFVVPNRADLLAKTGALNEAAILLQTQLASAPSTAADILRLRLAILALERLDVDTAVECLEEMNQSSSHTYWRMEARLALAEAQHLLGKTEDALQIIRDAMGVAAESGNQSRIDLLRAQIWMSSIWIKLGKIDMAKAWIELSSRSLDPWPRTFGHPIPRLAMAELEIAQRDFHKAIALLESLRTEGLQRQQDGILVSIYAHLAYTHAALGDDETAQAAADLAIQAGEKGGFAKSFHVFGVDVRHFSLGSPSTMVAYSGDKSVDEILLTRRQIEILQLVVAGKRNNEIADTLYLSMNTVKNHVNSIYKRLGVTNRHDAIRIAKQFKFQTDADADEN